MAESWKKYHGLDEYLISSFELSDNSSGSYFRNFMTEVCGPNLKDTPYSYKPKPENHTYSYNWHKNITFGIIKWARENRILRTFG